MAATNLTPEDALTTISTATEAPTDGKPSIWLVAIFDSWGILSSLVLLVLIWTRKELHHSSYMWLISNAIFTCLLACCLVTPAIIHQDLGMKTLPEGFCFIYGFLVWVVHFMVPMSLLMILLDRIVYVCDPLVYVRKMGNCALLLMIIVPWMVALMLAACSFLPFSGEIQQRVLSDDNEEYKYCTVKLGFQYVHSRARFIVCLYYAVPIILLAAAMFVLMVILCHRRHCCINHLDEFDFEFEDTRINVCHAVVPVSLVTFVYFILLLPSLVILFKGLETGQEVPSAETAMWVFISFEWIQPLLWMIFVCDIRHAFMRVFCCCCIEEGVDSTDDFKFEKT